MQCRRHAVDHKNADPEAKDHELSFDSLLFTFLATHPPSCPSLYVEGSRIFTEHITRLRVYAGGSEEVAWSGAE